jgi:CTP:molybdopterin cytidylyltransferase MocA
MGAFKPLLPLGHTTVIGQGVETLQQAGAQTICVVTGREAERLAAFLKPMGVECVNNADFAVTDMFCSARMGMKMLEGRVDAFFFLPGDVPLFSLETLKAMLEILERTACDVVQPACGGRRGHPILIRGAKIPELVSYGGDGGLRSAIASCCRTEQMETEDRGVLLDADTPQDYEILLQYQKENCNAIERKKRNVL